MDTKHNDDILKTRGNINKGENGQPPSTPQPKKQENYIKLNSGDTFELHIDFVISTSKPKTIDQTDLEQYMQMKFYEYMNNLNRSK